MIISAGLIYGVLPVAPYEAQGEILQGRGALAEMWGDQQIGSCSEARRGRGIAAIAVMGVGVVIGAAMGWAMRDE